jgi:hypothetical protein
VSREELARRKSAVLRTVGCDGEADLELSEDREFRFGMTILSKFDEVEVAVGIGAVKLSEAGDEFARGIVVFTGGGTCAVFLRVVVGLLGLGSWKMCRTRRPPGSLTVW